jgi:mono/diheme cytochrome c family protein
VLPGGRGLLAMALAGALSGCAHLRESSPNAVTQDLRRAPASANDGGRVYAASCSSCHQADGRGVPGAFPPLAGNPDVTGDPRRVIAVVENGQRGRLRVAGGSYDGVMPAWHGLLSDQDVAAVVSFIRTAWNNGAAPVSEADAAATK